MTLPSLLPFLVSTLRSIRWKLRSRILSILTTSPGAANSSTPSIIIPRLEYSRMDLTSRMLALVRVGPVRRKAMILRLSGSMTGAEINPSGAPVCMLMMGVLISFVPVTNISIL